MGNKHFIIDLECVSSYPGLKAERTVNVNNVNKFPLAILFSIIVNDPLPQFFI